jgi:hypothetical protein
MEELRWPGPIPNVTEPRPPNTRLRRAATGVAVASREGRGRRDARPLLRRRRRWERDRGVE